MNIQNTIQNKDRIKTWFMRQGINVGIDIKRSNLLNIHIASVLQACHFKRQFWYGQSRSVKTSLLGGAIKPAEEEGHSQTE